MKLWASGKKYSELETGEGVEVELRSGTQNAQAPKRAVPHRILHVTGCFRSFAIHLIQPPHFGVEEKETGGGIKPAGPQEPGCVSCSHAHPSPVLPLRAAPAVVVVLSGFTFFCGRARIR